MKLKEKKFKYLNNKKYFLNWLKRCKQTKVLQEDAVLKTHFKVVAPNVYIFVN